MIYFYDWHGHVTLSCKGPIWWARSLTCTRWFLLSQQQAAFIGYMYCATTPDKNGACRAISRTSRYSLISLISSVLLCDVCGFTLVKFTSGDVLHWWLLFLGIFVCLLLLLLFHNWEPGIGVRKVEWVVLTTSTLYLSLINRIQNESVRA